jgi:hypothetical protein
MPKVASQKPDKYRLYQNAVQDPAHDAALYQGFYRKARGYPAKELREDFCGTFALAAAWVKANPSHTALALDLDPEPLSYGRAHHFEELTKEQQARLKIFQKNVICITPPCDLIVGGNFSFYIFQERKALLSYFKSCLKSLKKGKGALILDMAGGPGMIKKCKEKRVVHCPPEKKFTYVWEMKDFDPITHRANYAIHFELQNGKKLNNAFTYDWRIWTVPEVRDLLEEAGFPKSVVIWDVSRDRHVEKHVIAERGSNVHSWIAYVVGLA